jgi:hypothetical protein
MSKEEKKWGNKTPHLVDEPELILLKKTFPLFLNPPWCETPKQNAKKKYNNQTNIHFLLAAVNIRRFHHFVFPRRPVAPQVAAKRKSDTPVVGGWIRGRKGTRIKKNLRCFGDVSNSPRQETPKNLAKKHPGKPHFWRLFCRFFSILFCYWHDLFAISFSSVFELPSLRNTTKRNKSKDIKEKSTLKFVSFVL